MKRPTKKVREQVVVYLEAHDRSLLEEMVERTGLSRTELFRRGLRRLAAEQREATAPGFSLRYLVATASDDGLPPDVAERADYYLYGGGYARRLNERRVPDETGERNESAD